MSTTPRFISHYARQVEITMPHRGDLWGYEVGAADTLTTAFAGTTPMFRVQSGGTFRSPHIVKSGLGRTQNCNRGLTWCLYDPEDYWVGGGTLPHDADQSYVRVAEISPAGVVGPEGPILVMPVPGLFRNPRPSLTVAGVAPALVPLPTLLPPPGAMHVVLPRFADNVRIRNLSGGTLYVAFDQGEPSLAIPANSTENLNDAVMSQVFLYGTAAARFDLRFAVVNGEMA